MLALSDIGDTNN